MKLKSLSYNLIISLVLLCSLQTKAQEGEEIQSEVVETSDITDSFQKLVKDASTWENFKVIPIAKVQAFGNQLEDSTSQSQIKIEQLTEKIADQKVRIDSSKSSIDTLQASLDESQRTNDEISFVGFSFSKNGYHIFVWLIICILALIIVVIYMLYLRSNSLTRQYKRDLEQVREELENQRSKAHENQVKLKRELQTMMNLMSEKGVKF